MLSYMLPTGDKPPPGETQSCTRLTRIQTRGDHQMTRNGINKTSPTATTMITTTLSTNRIENDASDNRLGNEMISESPKHNGGTTTTRKSTLHTSRITKDDSLHSINSEASTGGSDRKSKIANGAKHASLKRVSFGSSKGSMVETLVYETPVQEEPEINHFPEHNGRLPMMPVPDTDADSGWDNPFRPDGDLSREADEIVELIKGGKPITPTPGQNAPPLPGCDGKPSDDLDSSTSPLLNSGHVTHGNGTSHGNQNAKQPVNEKVASATSTATVEVGRVTAQGPGDASQVEHVTLKKKPKCKCCVLQ
ncbi:uncharacterized protein LOC135167305 isoform X2 [Diachasmimorpha longicaudata]|uniref:uncharacterized protein LOC135167305 isoform X2 n=1 Tax=Diachasmimorpha longicaudata TaxID=58733 RepID=UPI0030B8FCFD